MVTQSDLVIPLLTGARLVGWTVTDLYLLLLDCCVHSLPSMCNWPFCLEARQTPLVVRGVLLLSSISNSSQQNSARRPLIRLSQLSDVRFLIKIVLSCVELSLSFSGFFVDF